MTVIITLDRRVWLDGAGSRSWTFALLDSLDHGGGGAGRAGARKLRYREGPGLLREGVGMRCSSKLWLLLLVPSASECKEIGQKLTFEL